MLSYLYRTGECFPPTYHKRACHGFPSNPKTFLRQLHTAPSQKGRVGVSERVHAAGFRCWKWMKYILGILVPKLEYFSRLVLDVNEA